VSNRHNQIQEEHTGPNGARDPGRQKLCIQIAVQKPKAFHTKCAWEICKPNLLPQMQALIANNDLSWIKTKDRVDGYAVPCLP
jgi:hypothetical protein